MQRQTLEFYSRRISKVDNDLTQADIMQVS